jgi:VWFA-related protein
MRCATRSISLLLTLRLVSAFGQVPQQANPPGVIRITVNLVQVDAVVTDSKGHQVTNLKREDFEILEDGRPQDITNFSYVHIASKTGAPGTPLAPLRPQEARRTIVFVVDDLCLSFEDTYYVRRALKKFLNEQMQPGDVVAIFRSRSGLSTLQQFTDNKELLAAAIDRVRWYPSWGSMTPFSLRVGEPNQPASSAPVPIHSGFNSLGQGSWGACRQDVYAVGTLGAISYVAKGIRELPGRKSLILLSDGFQMNPEANPRVLDAARALIDLANRSSVVIYAVDAHGLDIASHYGSEAGMDYLASKTGGFLVHDTNDLNWAIDRILEDESGYYLIGYRPSAKDFQPGKGSAYHKLRVSVKVPGLHVRSRSGFYGVTDEETQPVYRTPADRLAAAVGSVLGTEGVPVSLACQYLNMPEGAKPRPVVRVGLHIDPRGLSFQDKPGGGKQFYFGAVVIAFGEFGALADAKGESFSGILNQAEYSAAVQDGIDYVVNLAVKHPGAYQLRGAVVDPASMKAGSASQYVVVPNLGNGRLTLSGIVLNASGRGEKAPAVRHFQAGDRVSYGFEVYNARLDRATDQAQVEGVIEILRDGKKVATAQPQWLSPKNRAHRNALPVVGHIQLGCAMEPGAYVLQATVADRLAHGKHAATSAWTDFEIAGAVPDCGNGGPKEP